MEYSFITIAPRPTLAGVAAPYQGPIHGLNRTKPWFIEFTAFAFKLRSYAKLNCLE